MRLLCLAWMLVGAGAAAGAVTGVGAAGNAENTESIASIADPTGTADARVTAVRDGIADAERRQREVLAHIFTIGRDIKDSVRRSTDLTRRSLGLEDHARTLARAVRDLEGKSAERGRLLNKRLDSLYRRRTAASALETLFSSTSPAELDRHRRFLRLLIDDDHRQMDAFVTGLREVKAERAKLNQVVRRLVTAQRESRAQEALLERRMSEKARLVAELRSTRETSIDRLRELRREGAGGEFAFFEMRGRLPAPMTASVARGFGAYVDPKFHFKLMHKGWLYASPAGASVRTVADGTVGVARDLPGFGPTVIVEHGDHYFTVYAGQSRIKVKEGASVRAGDVLGTSGEASPLFGPGVYFELRHFADAIDPRTWIKDPDFKTADRE